MRAQLRTTHIYEIYEKEWVFPNNLFGKCEDWSYNWAKNFCDYLFSGVNDIFNYALERPFSSVMRAMKNAGSIERGCY